MGRLNAALGPLHSTFGGISQQGFQGGLAAQARTGEAIRETLARIGANALQSAEFRARLQAANNSRKAQAAQQLQRSLMDTVEGAANREFAKQQAESEREFEAEQGQLNRRERAAQGMLERENRLRVAGIRSGDVEDSRLAEEEFYMAEGVGDLRHPKNRREYEAYVAANTPEGGEPPSVNDWRNAVLGGFWPPRTQADRMAAQTTTRDNTAEQVIQGEIQAVTGAADETTREAAKENLIQSLSVRAGLVSPEKYKDLRDQVAVVLGIEPEEVDKRIEATRWEARYQDAQPTTPPWLIPKRYIIDPITSLAGLDALGLPGPQTMFEALGRRLNIGDRLRGAAQPQSGGAPLMPPGQFIESLRPPPGQRGQPPLMFQGPPAPNAGPLQPVPDQQDVVDAILRQRNRQLRRE